MGTKREKNRHFTENSEKQWSTIWPDCSQALQTLVQDICNYGSCRKINTTQCDLHWKTFKLIVSGWPSLTQRGVLDLMGEGKQNDKFLLACVRNSLCATSLVQCIRRYFFSFSYLLHSERCITVAALFSVVAVICSYFSTFSVQVKPCFRFLKIWSFLVDLGFDFFKTVLWKHKYTTTWAALWANN